MKSGKYLTSAYSGSYASFPMKIAINVSDELAGRKDSCPPTGYPEENIGQVVERYAD